MRGEELYSVTVTVTGTEIPPRARRRDHGDCLELLEQRNTSACAEKSFLEEDAPA